MLKRSILWKTQLQRKTSEHSYKAELHLTREWKSSNFSRAIQSSASTRRCGSLQRRRKKSFVGGRNEKKDPEAKQPLEQHGAPGQRRAGGERNAAPAPASAALPPSGPGGEGCTGPGAPWGAARWIFDALLGQAVETP